MVKRIKLFVPLIFSTLFFIDQVNAQCAATFTSTAGANNTYSFQGTALPSNTTVSYSWNYGDGAIGNGSIVTHQYNSSGIFTVTLNIMTTAPSCSATISQTINAIQCPINSNFSYTINTGGVVNFSNTSTGTTSNTSVYWFFGDGNFAGPSNTASYTYTNNGTYSASVYLTDSVLGCADSIAFAITISGLPCNLSAGFTSSTINGSEYFSNTSTPNLPTPACSWNFGDGTNSTVFSPIHTYSASGTYTVLLTISQGTCASSFSSAVTTTIAAPPPPCSVTANFTYTLGSNGSVSFSNTSTGVSTTTFVTNWNFGNGNYAYANNTPTYTFTSNGTYSVALTVVDSSYACSDSIMIPITISNVTCNFSPPNGVMFGFNENNNGDGNFFTNITNTNTIYSWNFGNGNTSAVANPTTNYAAPGTYTVTLSIIDGTNTACNANLTNTIYVYFYLCTYSASFTSTLTGNTINVTNTSGGTSPAPNLYWNWGDGTYSYGLSFNSASHTYSINGTYTVALTVTDFTNTNCYDSISVPITINSASCPVNSNYSLQKDNTQLYSWFAYPANYGSNVASVIWTWGDGTSSTTLYPSHTYSAVGWYNICQTVSLTCGSQSTTCYNNYLNKTSESNAVVFIQVINPVTGVKGNEATKKNVSIEPNPNNGEFTLNLNGFQSADPLEILIYNAYGELINKSLNTLTSENGIKKIDLTNFPNGCYIVTIKNTNAVISRKLIINR